MKLFRKGKDSKLDTPPASPSVSEQSYVSYQSVQQFNNGGVTFSTMDFFDRFVRSANERGLLKTPLPTPLSRNHILLSSIQLLQAARLEKSSVKVQDDNFGGTIWITEESLNQIQLFLEYRHHSKAALLIQKVWRGYQIRNQFQKTITDHLYYEQYVTELSNAYTDILQAARRAGNNPTEIEIEFMKKLNQSETYRVCHEYILKIFTSDKKKLKLTLLPGNIEHQNTLLMYQEYAPKVLQW
jgi:hypothetical protein